MFLLFIIYFDTFSLYSGLVKYWPLKGGLWNISDELLTKHEKALRILSLVLIFWVLSYVVNLFSLWDCFGLWNFPGNYFKNKFLNFLFFSLQWVFTFTPDINFLVFTLFMRLWNFYELRKNLDCCLKTTKSTIKFILELLLFDSAFSYYLWFLILLPSLFFIFRTLIFMRT